MPDEESLSLLRWVGILLFLAVPVMAGGLLGLRLNRMVERGQRRDR